MSSRSSEALGAALALLMGPEPNEDWVAWRSRSLFFVEHTPVPVEIAHDDLISLQKALQVMTDARYEERIARRPGLAGFMNKAPRSAYPGEGHPWADFLHHRRRVLVEWEDEGKTPEDSARTMCMDPGQVRLILMGARRESEAHATTDGIATADGETA